MIDFLLTLKNIVNIFIDKRKHYRRTHIPKRLWQDTEHRAANDDRRAVIRTYINVIITFSRHPCIYANVERILYPWRLCEFYSLFYLGTAVFVNVLVIWRFAIVSCLFMAAWYFAECFRLQEFLWLVFFTEIKVATKCIFVFLLIRIFYSLAPTLAITSYKRHVLAN